MPLDNATPLYAELEDRILARDQVGASETYYALLRAGRPLPELIAEAVRVHAPYTHVPYHERIDDGYPNFVNNDHCLLSARATINLARLLPGPLSMLPMAQTIWYIPTGLDIWNQKIGHAPGHYMRGFRGGAVENPPAPAVYLARSGTVAPGRSNPRAPRQLADRRSSWPGARRLPPVPRPDGGYRPPQGRAGGARFRRPDRCAGPRPVQPLLHDRAQILPRPLHCRNRQFHRLGECASRALCRRTGYRGRAALVLHVRNGLQRHQDVHRRRGTPRRSLCRRQRARNRHALPDRTAQSGGIRSPDSGHHPRTGTELPPCPLRAADRRQRTAPHPRHDPDRRGAGGDRNRQRHQLLPAPALLRILQHARLVLGQFRPPVAAETSLRRSRVPQSRRLASETHRRPQPPRHPRAPPVPTASPRLSSWTASSLPSSPSTDPRP